MALRYRGKPLVEDNIQADAFTPICFCKFVAIGKPMATEKCEVHADRPYPCGVCGCNDYKPKAVKTAPSHWPNCTCGHVAQEHN